MLSSEQAKLSTQKLRIKVLGPKRIDQGGLRGGPGLPTLLQTFPTDFTTDFYYTLYYRLYYRTLLQTVPQTTYLYYRPLLQTLPHDFTTDFTTDPYPLISNDFTFDPKAT